MLKYTCQCMNVSFETTTSSSSLEKKNDFIKSIESLLLSDNLNDSNNNISNEYNTNIILTTKK